MATIKEMKVELDRLGIAYPAKGFAEDYVKLLPDADQVEQADHAGYINKGKRNYFTEGGRCMPNEVVFLSEEHAKQYPNLEKV